MVARWAPGLESERAGREKLEESAGGELVRREATRPPLCGETEAASWFPLPSVWPWLLPLWRRERVTSDLNLVKFAFS